jgi:hypothetical protein
LPFTVQLATLKQIFHFSHCGAVDFGGDEKKTFILARYIDIPLLRLADGWVRGREKKRRRRGKK